MGAMHRPVCADLACGLPRAPPIAALNTHARTPWPPSPLPAADLAIDLVVPPAFGVPRRATPAGAHWSKSQSQLRWLLGGVYPGLAGHALAVFRVEEGEEAALAGLDASHGVVRLRGDGGEWGPAVLCVVEGVDGGLWL